MDTDKSQRILTFEQRELRDKLAKMLDALPSSDDRNELMRVWFRLAAHDSEQLADWQRATELLQKLDPLVVGSALCLTTEKQSVELTQRAAAILAQD